MIEQELDRQVVIDAVLEIIRKHMEQGVWALDITTKLSFIPTDKDCERIPTGTTLHLRVDVG